MISTLHGLPSDPFLSLHVRRNHLVEDSLNQLSRLRAVDLKKRLRIEFINEDGVDAGGLTKEWFLLLVRQLLDPNYGLFVYDEDSRLAWFNSWSFENTAEYSLIGMVLGLAIYQSTILDVPFPPALFKKLLGQQATLDDFMALHPSLGRGLSQMLAFDGSVEDVFCRDFVVEVEYLGRTEKVPLKENGERIPVTNQNRQEYVNLLVDWTFNKQAAKQFEAFKSGFDTVCRGSPLTLLKPDELELLVRGDPEIDFKGLVNWDAHLRRSTPFSSVSSSRRLWLSTTALARTNPSSGGSGRRFRLILPRPSANSLCFSRVRIASSLLGATLWSSKSPALDPIVTVCREPPLALWVKSRCTHFVRLNAYVVSCRTNYNFIVTLPKKDWMPSCAWQSTKAPGSASSSVS